MDETKDQVKTTYESLMVILAAISIATIWYESTYNSFIIWGTWAIFFVDLVIRLWRSDNKKAFIKANPFLVIAAIPLDAIFQFARVARILHLIRLKSITKYYTMPAIRFLKDKSLSLVVAVTFVVVFLSVIPLYLIEDGVDSYFRAFIGSSMSLLFFGYNFIDPTHIVSYVIIVILTVFGVILHGMIISTAFDIIAGSDWFQSLKGKVLKKFK
ncbi:hypothetical protein CEY16_13995 [Halalkalibacillus sediminis]|uniref:Uncharacterized protein n=1 Tax=Halalkalibacillus sediminis TaxID=2018042 RepID=A0A2I0QRG1_9BACI|nr:hypothetical protein [Halalkalibacillus sediminis]PKR76913.1 hypothetical protein CEY16_13995 [Halalkalibacillus sediminis]